MCSDKKWTPYLAKEKNSSFIQVSHSFTLPCWNEMKNKQSPSCLFLHPATKMGEKKTKKSPALQKKIIKPSSYAFLLQNED